MGMMKKAKYFTYFRKLQEVAEFNVSISLKDM
jgi:hypothetical protein